MRKSLLYSALGVAAGAAAYIKLIRPRLMTWGASFDEAHQFLVGDDLIDAPSYLTTRAITIHSTPEAIWPWLVQMGERRAGFYSYAFIDRILNMKIHSAHRILPRFQHLEEGDALDSRGNLTVRHIEPDKALVLGPSKQIREQNQMDFLWTIALRPVDDQHTRLISRVRATTDLPRPANLFWLAMMDPGQFIMEQKFLREIKSHAEGTHEKWPPEAPFTLH